MVATAAQADNPSWAEQQARNQEMTRQALSQRPKLAPQVLQSERWRQEWIQQHPGQPVPSFGVLEHLHAAETMSEINSGFDKMREARQAQLQQEHQMAKKMQERTLAAQNIKWSAQQWQNWDNEYDQQMHQRANEYSEAVRQSGEAARMEALEDQRRKTMGY